VYFSQFRYTSRGDGSTVTLSIQGTDRTYTNCVQHGSIRRPLTDCAPGEQRIARGSVTTSHIERSVAPNAVGLSGYTI
jgi:hypothetical protein